MKNFEPLIIEGKITMKFMEEVSLERVYKMMRSMVYEDLKDEERLSKKFGITKEKYDLKNVEIELPNIEEAEKCSGDLDCEYSFRNSSEICLTCNKKADCKKDSLYFVIDIKVYERDLEQSGSKQ